MYVRGKVPESEVHEIVQDSLAVLVEKHEVVRDYRAFLYKVLSNKLKQYYARRARQAGIVGVVWTSEVLSVEALSTRLSIRVARRDDLEQAMLELPLRQYKAFELRYIVGLTEAQAADALGISRATLKRDLDRARGSLAAVLGDVEDDEQLARIVQSLVRE